MTAVDLRLLAKQTVAFESEATEILYGGAAGGGKSHLLRSAAIVWCHQIPGLQVYLFRRTFPDLFKNHMVGPGSFPELLGAWVDSGHAKILWNKNQISFWNGSCIHLCHCQRDKDVYNYQGAEIHVLMIDELTHFSDDQYRYLRGRVRLGGLKIPEQYRGKFPKIICGSNPGGIGHNWAKATFIEPAPPMEIWNAPDDEGGFKRQFIPALLSDNPIMTDNDPDYHKRLLGLGSEHLIKAMLDGNWDIVAGGMFDDVWDASIHILEPFTLPKSWYLDRSFDWGGSHPWTSQWWAECDGTEAELPDGSRMSFPRGTLILFDEIYGWNGKPNKGTGESNESMAKKIAVKDRAYKQRGLAINPGPADNQIFEAPQGKSIHDDFKKHGVYFTRCDKSPGSRATGWQRMRSMMRAGTQYPMEHPALFVFNTCRHFIRTVPVLPRDEKKPDDVDTNVEDHSGDAARYRVLRPQSGPAQMGRIRFA